MSIVALLLALAWLVTDHYPPWASFHSELPAAVAGACAAALAVRRYPRIGFATPVGVLFGCALVPWAQWVAGVVLFSGDAIVVSLYLAGAGVCFWAGFGGERADHDDLRRAIAAAILAGAILTTGVLLYQWFGLSGISQIVVAQGILGERAVGNMGQPNHAAALLCAGLATIVLWHASGSLGSVVTAIAAGYLALGLAVTQSRVPWLALLVVGVWMVSRRRTLWVPLRLPTWTVLTWLAGYLIVFWLVSVGSESLFATPPIDADASRVGLGKRPVLLGQWLEALRIGPWWGYGWGQGRIAQMGAAVSHPGTEASDYSHNLALDLIAWNGLPIGLLLVAVGLGWYLRLASRVRSPGQTFSFVVLTIVGCHSLVEYPFAYTYFLVPTALLAGQLHAEALGPARYLTSRVALGIAAMVVATGVVVVARDYLLVEGDIRQLREQLARIGGSRQSDRPEEVWLLNQMTAFSRASRIRPAAGMPQSELGDLAIAARRFPNTWLLQQSALAMALNGNDIEAHHQMQLLCALHGDAFYRIAYNRLSQLAAEHGSRGAAFVDSLIRPAEPNASLGQNRRPICQG